MKTEKGRMLLFRYIQDVAMETELDSTCVQCCSCMGRLLQRLRTGYAPRNHYNPKERDTKQKYKEGLLCSLAVVLDCSVQLKNNSDCYKAKDLKAMGKQLDTVGTFLSGLGNELGVTDADLVALNEKIGLNP